VILPSLDAWWVVGPFDAPFPGGLDTCFPSETRPELDATYADREGRPVRWQQVRRDVRTPTDVTGEFRVNLEEVFGGRRPNAVAYALAYLHAPAATSAVLALGANDGLVVWLNGRPVYRNAEYRAYLSRQQRVPVQLKAGTNTLLLKLNHGTGPWLLCVHVETADGQVMPEIETRARPA
jgi:hypothetical protein